MGNAAIIYQIQETRRAREAIEARAEKRASDAGVRRPTKKGNLTDIQLNVDELGYVVVDTGPQTGGTMDYVPTFDLSYRQFSRGRKTVMKKKGSWRAR